MKRKFLITFLIVVFLIIFCYFQNNYITISILELEYKNLPKSFDGYKIVHLSDLHSKEFGKKQNRILEKIQKLSPDIIVFTGDIIDRRRYNEQPAIDLMKGLLEIAPVYYVEGNHEVWSGNNEIIQEKLSSLGVTILSNSALEIDYGNDSITLAGIKDPSHSSEYINEKDITITNIEETLKKKSSDNFTLLLSHRPEAFDQYSSSKIDLIFCGHAHGGQIRLPFIGGIVAPNQGFFPKYTSGVYESESSKMIVSRGLGNSLAPLRIFNQPEIVYVELQKE